MKALLLFLMCINVCIAQDIDLMAQYQITSTPVDGYVIESKGKLYVGDDFSNFISNQGDYPGVMYEDGSVLWLHPEGNQIYKDYKKSLCKMRKLEQTTVYCAEEPLAQQDWKLGSEVQEIAGYQCMNATTTFRGRKYTAWYAPEIPISDGPWKFYGLPGLIFRVSDDHEYFAFELIELKMPYELTQNEKIKYETRKAKKVDLSTFRRAQAIENDLYIKRSKASSTTEGFKVEVTTGREIEIFE